MARNAVGDSVHTAYGTFYAHPKPMGTWCDHCVGNSDDGVCSALPIGCADAPSIIWRDYPPAVGAKVPTAPKEAHSVDPTPPAKLYKPAHGGYPGTPRKS